MAISDSREIVIEATPQEILDVISDVESLPEWSDAHQSSEVLERDERGRPLRAKAKVKTVGVTDEQVIAYTWHDDGVSWTLESAKQQRPQDARYILIPEGEGTRVNSTSPSTRWSRCRFRAQKGHQRGDKHRDTGIAEARAKPKRRSLIFVR